jgi:glycosyltransferase involved in cell wall biosynthesis
VIDGITSSLANIGILRLIWAVLVNKNRLVLIAHDVTPHLLRDNGKLKSSWVAQLFFAIQSRQAWFIELLICRLSTLVVFISAFDQAYYQRLVGDRGVALCPLIPAHKLPEEAEQLDSTTPHFLFMGPLDFPPNAFAFKWICTKLAAQLYEKAPHISIVLVGKGTDALPWATTPNIKGLGFVSEARLHRLLETSTGLLSPIIHGSGIKTKVLQGLAAGCPILATEESLRGFDFMGLSPMLRLDDAGATSTLLANFAADTKWQADLREVISKKWGEYVSFRTGRLAIYISDVCHGIKVPEKSRP